MTSRLIVAALFHTHKPDSQVSSSLYPQLVALKLDPDLDGNPPFHSSAPPSYNPTAANERSEANSIMSQLQAAHPEVPVPPQDSTSSPTSPIVHSLSHPEKDTTFNMPMVVVSGPQGATLVFHLWTSDDITAAAQHLPSLTTSGKMFAEQFLTFCREFKLTMNELKRFLITKMKPTD